MLEATSLIANAQTARDHSDRARHLLRINRASPAMKRRASLLEEAATRMELEAKAALLYSWRGLTPPAAWELRTAPALHVPYVERRQVLRQAHVVRKRPVVTVLDMSPPREPDARWALLLHLGSGTETGRATSGAGR